MIILDQADDNPLKQPEMVEVRSVNTPSPSHGRGTPPYSPETGSVDNTQRDNNYDSIEQQTTGQNEDGSGHRPKKKRVLRRILAILSLLIIWMLIAVVRPIILQQIGWNTGKIVDSLPRFGSGHDGGGKEHFPDTPIIPIDGDQDPHNIQNPARPDALRSLCMKEAPWSETVSYSRSTAPVRFSADAPFQIPVALAERLFLISRVPHSSGQIQILDSAISDDIARIYVTMRYSDPKARDNTVACLMERFPGEIGIGIFGSDREDSEVVDVLDFDIVVLLPPNPISDTVPGHYNLETDLPKFAFSVQSKAQFEFFSVKSSGMPLSFEALSAKSTHIETSEAPIVGTFNIEGVMSITTSKYPISANITIDNPYKFPSRLAMQNTNGTIDTAINLVSSGTRGKFDIEVIGENAAVNLDVERLPLNAQMHLNIETSQEPVSISLPSTYQGAYSLISSISHPPSLEPQELGDEQSRRRIDVINRQDSENGDEILEGSVSWIQTDNLASKSTVQVRTSHASNTLIL